MVQSSHQSFLLARDIVAMSFLFIPISGLPFIFLGKQPLNWYYLSLLVIQYLIFVPIAQNYGHRFVTNVLAQESVKDVKNKKKTK